MTDLLRETFGLIQQRYRDMGDGTHALVRAADVSGDVGVASMTVPDDAPIVGQAIIAVTGTRVALSATSIPLPGGTVIVQCHVATTYVAVGGDDVTNTVDGSGNGVLLAAGEQTVILADDLADVYINGAADDLVSYSAG